MSARGEVAHQPDPARTYIDQVLNLASAKDRSGIGFAWTEIMELFGGP